MAKKKKEYCCDDCCCEEKKGKIYNSMPVPATIKETKPIEEEKREERKIVEDDDSDWGAVPAFLRRSKK